MLQEIHNASYAVAKWPPSTDRDWNLTRVNKIGLLQMVTYLICDWEGDL